MKIVDVRATTVTVPLEAALRHANGCHWQRFMRTLAELETDDGLIGLGEMGGGGESAEAAFRAKNGAIRVPTGPGLGVKLDRAKVDEYAELYKRLGSYPYDQDPLRLGWAPILPNNRFADPNDDREPKIAI